MCAEVRVELCFVLTFCYTISRPKSKVKYFLNIFCISVNTTLYPTGIMPVFASVVFTVIVSVWQTGFLKPGINKEGTNMTILNCSATTCIYNKDRLCSKGSIEVGGSTARSADETCCRSFREQDKASVTNAGSEHCGCEKIKIDCKAEECTYNEHCRCTASAIDIAGHDACTCQDTKCRTFACKC